MDIAARHLFGAVMVTVYRGDDHTRNRLSRMATKPSTSFYLRHTHPTLNQAERQYQYTSAEQAARASAETICDEVWTFVPSDPFHGAIILRNIGGTHPRLGGRINLYISKRMKVETAFARWTAFLQRAHRRIERSAGTLSYKQGGEVRLYRHPPPVLL